MNSDFFESPILNSLYRSPARYWKMDKAGQPTGKIVANRRKSSYITPFPKPRTQRGHENQGEMGFGGG